VTITISDIATTVSRYLDAYPTEETDLGPLLTALGAGGGGLLSRAGLPGHVTCSVAVLDGQGAVLMVKHRALDMWLIPGGHIEPADDSLLGAALRELDEETGVSWRDIAELPDAGAIPVDIDVHPIPANPAKGEPGHWHADFRYVIEARRPDTITLQAEEVSGCNWRLPALLHQRRLAAKIAGVAACSPVAPC
jgi:8-oxo-dGTP pyrophosphatase MutT (NUDIX family)